MLPHLELLNSSTENGRPVLSYLKNVVLIRSNEQPIEDSMISYDEFILQGTSVAAELVDKMSTAVGCHDLCNLQFTSGTTGEPKAAMLTH